MTSVHHRYDTRILYKECISLKNHGLDVHLIVADEKEDEVFEGISIHSVGKTEGKISRFIKATKRVFNKALDLDADIYHFHDPELLPYGKKLKKKGKVVIYDTHEDLPRQLMSKEYVPILARRPLALGMEWYEDNIVKNFDAVITATPHISKRFSRLNDTVVDINNFPLLSDLDLQVTKWETKRNEICYIGSITEIRGLSQIILATSLLPNIVLNLAGSVAPKSYLQTLSSLDGWTKTNYMGQINRNEVKSVMKQSKVGLVTFLPYGNHIHSQPNKLFEYMAQGIPLVASNFDLWKEIVERYDCGICVNPRDPEAIAGAIKFLLEHDELSEKKGQNGRNAILEKFNWDSEQKKLTGLYDMLLKH
ncbi:glycosyltransferase involved in cell wall biosynthesis [Zeaxanthinibacter enoshimensis]|uniref:Glycosyltransferase involved in cell wall biosynthesis n=1 Tax=Zeaxanthinibacter enoshimensis TaxID=392009 RepID=A0A4R6TSC3_9FLAO|nr:glycosyltransferase involved in cell wall biosynthesis [Zeaxanthinibacter enoshimensis]